MKSPNGGVELKKKPLLYICLFFITLVNSIVLGQEKKIEIRVGGGLSPFLGADVMEDFYKLGFNTGVRIGYMVSPTLAIGGRVAYNSFSIDEPPGFTIDGGTFSVIEILAEGLFYFRPNNSERFANFYVLGGFGITRPKISDITISAFDTPAQNFSSITELEFMAAFGIGGKFNVTSSVGVFAELRLSILLTQGNEVDFPSLEEDEIVYLPITVGFIF
ncbi:outer membrane beta-barrel protein [candidate division KSB1 bacterium]|nr:outer membrane beta-barrel protein [candidate division KSB1 bacterium]